MRLLLIFSVVLAMFVTETSFADLDVEFLHPRSCDNGSVSDPVEGLFLRQASFDELGLRLSLSYLSCSSAADVGQKEIINPYAFFVKPEYFEPRLPDQNHPLHSGFIFLDLLPERRVLTDESDVSVFEIEFPYSQDLEKFLVTEERFLAIRLGRHRTAKVSFFKIVVDPESSEPSIVSIGHQ